MATTRATPPPPSSTMLPAPMPRPTKYMPRAARATAASKRTILFATLGLSCALYLGVHLPLYPGGCRRLCVRVNGTPVVLQKMPKGTMPPPLLLSPRAKQIAEGLVRTGRASDTRLFRTWLQLRATAGNFYWIDLDGSALLRGATFDGADELQQSFADAMAHAWATR
jgi:hypothetical protein